MNEKLNRLRTNASNALRQKFTNMTKTNTDATDGSTEEPTTEEIEDELAPRATVDALSQDVDGLVAGALGVPREEAIPSDDPEAARERVVSVATSLTADEVEEIVASDVFIDAEQFEADAAFVAEHSDLSREAAETMAPGALRRVAEQVAPSDGSGVVGEDRAVYDGGEEQPVGEAGGVTSNYGAVPGRARRNYDDATDDDGDGPSPGSYSGWRGETTDDGPGAGTLSDYESRQSDADDDSLARTSWQQKQEEKRRRGREMRLNAARKEAARKARDGK